MTGPKNGVRTRLHDLAHRLAEHHVTAEEARAQALDACRQWPISSQDVQSWLATAHVHMAQKPRRGWALAFLAHSVAQSFDDPHLLAESDFTLAMALSVLGRFAQAIPLFQTAAQRFESDGCADKVVHCRSEMAIACICQGQFEEARVLLARARALLPHVTDASQRAHCDRVEGLLHREQNRYDQAVTLLRQAGDIFVAAGKMREAARSWCYMVIALRYTRPEEALDWLARARHVQELGQSILFDAHHDYMLAGLHEEWNQYSESLTLYRRARVAFAQEGMDFFAARCDLNQGIVHYRLNQYEEALAAYRRARAFFADQNLHSHAANCDLNIAVVHYATDRYREAITVYERVAEEALAEGRLLRAARCYTNMGLCYDRLGRYDRALALHNRARQAFLDSGSPLFAALCEENLAGTYQSLGRYDAALAHYQHAYQVFVESGRPIYAARCDAHMAELHLAMGNPDAALARSQRARVVYEQHNLPVHSASAARDIARALSQAGHAQEALTLLAEARKTFAQRGLLVDVALCDVATGEVRLLLGEHFEAADAFRAAQAVLEPGLPDDAWRARYGLGHCARARGRDQQALEHWLAAADMASQVRAALRTERLSSSFFARRHHVFRDAIELALALGKVEEALRLIEASKTTAIFSYNHPGRLRARRLDDPYLSRLVTEERVLRRRLDALRRQLQAIHDQGAPSMQGLRTRGEPATVLQELVELSHRYEDVVEQLRLSAPAQADVPPPATLAAFREAAAAHLPPRWAALAYYLTEGRLVIIYLDAGRVQAYTRDLSDYDRLVLRQCVNPEPERRELIYRNTVRGFRVASAPGRAYLRHLHQLLIPAPLLESSPPEMLVISAHGALHGLPFHALLEGDTPLIERAPVLYAPSLHVLQALWSERPVTTAGARPLLCGVSEFDGRARPLPYAEREIQAIASVLPGPATTLLNQDATVAALQDLNDRGDLVTYDMLHFATHAIAERTALTLSRILLAEDALTVMDIMELSMNARLVTLSACQTAWADVTPGDEMMTLARAFFYAGVRAVVASLWLVEDEATALLMRHFYERLGAGEAIPEALRQAQVALHRKGYAPYQWASFVAIGTA